MIPAKRAPTHRGETLREEFLMPNGMTQVDLAEKLGIPLQREAYYERLMRVVDGRSALMMAAARYIHAA